MAHTAGFGLVIVLTTFVSLVIGEIVPVEPNYFSILQEAVEDRVGYMMAVLDLQKRLVKAA